MPPRQPAGRRRYTCNLNLVRYSPMPNFSIGVDLGGTNLRIAAVNQQGDLMEKVTLGTRVALGKDHVIHDMCDAIRLLAAKYRDGGRAAGDRHRRARHYRHEDGHAARVSESAGLGGVSRAGARLSGGWARA